VLIPASNPRWLGLESVLFDMGRFFQSWVDDCRGMGCIIVLRCSRLEGSLWTGMSLSFVSSPV
jgi:hypothetical protein